MQHSTVWSKISGHWLKQEIKRLKSALVIMTFAIAMIMGCISDAVAIFIRDDVPATSYNTLATQARFQAAGYLGYANDVLFFCSGTLITPVSFLTAAHCLDPDADGIHEQMAENLVVGFDIHFPENGFPANNISSFSINPNWVSSNGSLIFDLAVLELTAPIVGIIPASISLRDPLGQLGTMIGYGDQRNGLGNFLIGANNKLGAQNIIDQSGLGIRTDFDKPDCSTNSYGSCFPVSLEGTTSAGDSGGPLFVNFERQELLVGVLHGGFNFLGSASQYGDTSTWVPLNNPVNVAFLHSLSQDIYFVSTPSTVSLVLIGLSGAIFVRWQQHERTRPTARIRAKLGNSV